MYVMHKTVFAWWPVTATFEERRIYANVWRQRKYTPITGRRIWWRTVHAIGPPATPGGRGLIYYAVPLD